MRASRRAFLGLFAAAIAVPAAAEASPFDDQHRLWLDEILRLDHLIDERVADPSFTDDQFNRISDRLSEIESTFMTTPVSSAEGARAKFSYSRYPKVKGCDGTVAALLDDACAFLAGA